MYKINLTGGRVDSLYTPNELDLLLQSLPDNTVTTPYEIELDGTDGNYNFLYPQRYEIAAQTYAINNQLTKALKNNPSKYVSILWGPGIGSDGWNHTNCSHMFEYCQTIVTMEPLKMPNARFMIETFDYCTSLVSYDLSGVTMEAKYSVHPPSELGDAGNISNIKGIFAHCSSLREIRNWSFSPPEPNEYNNNNLDCFLQCSSLENVYVVPRRPSEPPADAETWRAFGVSHDSAAKDDVVNVYADDGTVETTVHIKSPSDGGRSVEATDWVDELALSDTEIPGSKVADMMSSMIPVTGNTDAVDPSVDNFVLWSKDGDRKKINLHMSDLRNDLSLSDFTNDLSLSDFTNDLVLPVGRPANVRPGSVWLG